MTKASNEAAWCLYILQTERGTLYTGITNNLTKRFEAHTQGKGAKYTRANKPQKIVYQENFENRSEASKREAEVKKTDT